VDDVKPAFKAEELLGHRHADLIEAVQAGVFLRQVKEGGKSLLLKTFKL